MFQKYFKELKRGKSHDILEKFDSHASLDQHVDSMLRKPGLTQYDLEYLFCQYFMFHVSNRKRSPSGQQEDWSCEVDTCRMSEVEDLLDKDAGSLLFASFSH